MTAGGPADHGGESRGPATIVIADDASEVRLLVRTRLRMHGGFEVVGEAGDGLAALALVQRLRPELLLLDVSMPRLDGLEALPRVLAASPQTRVVLFSGFQEQGLAERALRLGAAAFVEKAASVETLIERLCAVRSRPVHSSGPSGPPTDPVTDPVSDPVTGSSASADHSAREVTAAPYVQRGPLSVDQHVLDEHLERFREVFDQAAIGMATMTLTGTLVRVNDAFSRLLRTPVASLVGTAYAEVAGGTEDAVAGALERIRHELVETVQVEHTTSDDTTSDDTTSGDTAGGDRTLLATLAPVRDSLGRPLYVFLQLQDVTAERVALDALRHSEERFRLLVETVEDYAIFMLDPDGLVVSWNAGAQRNQGYAAEEIIGRHFRAFYPSEVARSGHPEHELEVALREGRYEEEGWRVRKDGRRYYAYVVLTAVHDPTGRHIGFAKVTRDVTERRAAEEHLRQSEQRFRLLVETVQDYAIFMLDPHGRIVSWNAGAQRSKGYAAEEIIGRHFSVFYPPEVAATGHCEHELEEALREGRYEEEGWRIRKDGTRFWANVVITAVHDDLTGQHIGFAKVTRDTSERRRLEQERETALAAVGAANTELEALNRRLQQAADDQTQFLAVTAHELRTPVSVLASSADLLSRHWRELEEGERQELFDAMGSSTVRLRRLLEDLLTASRLQASALSLHQRPVEVGDVVADACATVVRSQPGTDVRVEVEQGLVVDGDRDRLSQAVENLVLNALRHGVPPVRVDARRHGDQVRLRVSDEGAGVAERVVPRLFERFATGAQRGGTGLGLFIVRELARAHGGEAHYEAAAEGARAAFVITLPLHRSETAGVRTH